MITANTLPSDGRISARYVFAQPIFAIANSIGIA